MMIKADVCTGSLSSVVPVAPGPSAISALLGLAGGLLSLSLSPSVAFFHWSIWKTTFMCCNSHNLLIGRDESMIESFSSIIRCGGVLRRHSSDSLSCSLGVSTDN